MEHRKKLKIVFIIKIIVCVAGIIVGICLWNLNPGSYYWDQKEYGADFYTDIYQRTKEASHNVYYLSQNISYISSCFMIIISAFALVCSIGSYFKGLTLIKISESLSAKPTVAKSGTPLYVSTASKTTSATNDGWVCKCGTRNPSVTKYFKSCGKQNLKANRYKTRRIFYEENIMFFISNNRLPIIYAVWFNTAANI